MAARQKKTEKANKVAEIVKGLEEGVKEFCSSSEDFRKYLTTMAKFHHYSLNNTILIALQKPDATYVAGYHAWQDKFHRQVKKGEKGIKILAPCPVRIKKEQTEPASTEQPDGKADPDQSGKEIVKQYFRVATVFDISSTEGEPLPTIGVDELTGTVSGYESFMKALQTVSPVPIALEPVDGGAKGYYHTVEKRIVIKEGMSEAQTIKTGIHEVTHAILHDRDRMKAEGVVKDQVAKELEAEGTAFCVASYFFGENLDTSEYSFPYIAGWSGSTEIDKLKASLNTIRETTTELIDGIGAELERSHLEEQGKEKAAEDMGMVYEPVREKISLASSSGRQESVAEQFVKASVLSQLAAGRQLMEGRDAVQGMVKEVQKKIAGKDLVR